jgi:N-methylhydantoinase A/oxoprolinase/acetone carboxylase beta subunit
MLLGIDVGGTFTDAVIIKDAKILALGKCTTTHGAVLHGILAALDKVLTGYDPAQIKRVVISSTIVTNALTENKIDPSLFSRYARTWYECGKKLPDSAANTEGLCGSSG